MKTDELIGMLAAGAGPVPPHAVARRYLPALAAGSFIALLLMALMLGPRPDLAVAAHLPMFWTKLVFVAALTGASLLACTRLSRPGSRLGWAPAALAIPVAFMWLLAALVLVQAEPARRTTLFFGETWNSCPWLIAMLSAPVFVAAIWAMKGLAPTRLRLAGAYAGLLAGGMGALVYCLHCPEIEAPFVGFWYLLGMSIPTALGAAAGPQLLRW